MWNKQWREDTWNRLSEPWDLLVIGGGITGAGVLRQAVQAGLKTLLVEAQDFSSGTSSKSSKMIHGGFRYLANKQYSVTRESVREREWMLEEAPGLVTRIGYYLPVYSSYPLSLSAFRQGVIIYDLLAPKWDHRTVDTAHLCAEFPELNAKGLVGGMLYYDAGMDDSRLVIRVLQEACQSGGAALNYTRAESLLCRSDGTVCGAVLRCADGRTAEVLAKVVINACGPWSDELRVQVGGEGRIRKLRGSHLIFSRERFPAREAVTLLHPRDRRSLFVLPFEGATLVGTTDLDHPKEMEEKAAEPFATGEEITYLLEAANFLFPSLLLGSDDIVSTFSGVRPTLRNGSGDAPSKVSRRHALYRENGLITITGGKYTIFRIMARQAVEAALTQIGRSPSFPKRRIFDKVDFNAIASLDPHSACYLGSRHGADTPALLAAAHESELEAIHPLRNIWAELRWAAREEAVLHLSDLLLRRVRLGLLLPEGAVGVMDRIRSVVQPELGWDDPTWERELTDYRATWQKYYSPKPTLRGNHVQ
jgi:glycerol-3-phosphate dehydrogenase